MLTIFQIEVTSRCNMACSFCPHPTMTRPKKDMTVQTFKACKRSLRPGQTVGMHMVGEPLLHPRLLEWADEISYDGRLLCKAEINTNGLLLTQENINRILGSALVGMTVDVTPDKGPYELLEKVVAGVHRMLRTDFPFLRVQVVRHKNSPPYPEIIQDLRDEIALCENTEFVEKFLDTWAGSVEWSMDRTNVSVPEVRSLCPEPWNRVSILQNGDVVPCCRDAHGEYVYGNINDMTLDEIEDTSPKLRELRLLMIRKQWHLLPEPCKSCREWHIPMDRSVFQP